MKKFEDFSMELRELHDSQKANEWKGAFETAINYMYQALKKHIETTKELPNIYDVELHLLNYEDPDYPTRYDSETNAFSFSTNTLPDLTSMSLSTKVRTVLENMLHQSGWTHMYVSIETLESGTHIIAHTM